MTAPLGVDGCVELAVLERAGFIESRHIGAAVITAPDGSVLRELGDGSAWVFARSSLKLFQAISVMRAGVELDGQQAVIAAASHGGTEAHLQVVRRLLDRAGADEHDLRCPREWPLDGAARFAAQSAGLGERRVTMNCSGKHASFLLACATNGWQLPSYLEPTHPMQALVRQTIEDYTREPVGPIGIDGCGAPVFATTLRGLARGVGRVSCAATSGDGDVGRGDGGGGHVGRGDTVGAAGIDTDINAATLTRSILAEPWAIDGPGRSNTVVIERLGIVAKLGAEGMLVLGTPDGTAVALKLLDGGMRAIMAVGLELLVSVGALTRSEVDPVIAATTERILGGGAPVGELRASDLVRG